jgi:hypothetical protein
MGMGVTHRPLWMRAIAGMTAAKCVTGVNNIWIILNRIGLQD